MKKAKTLLPDTNIILRYLLRDDEFMYKKAFSSFEDIRQGNLNALILEGVLIECVYVLLKFYKAPRNEVSEKLQNLLHYKGIVNQDKDALIEALGLFADRNVDIVDAILFIKAQRNEMEVFSFDKDMLKLSRK